MTVLNLIKKENKKFSERVKYAVRKGEIGEVSLPDMPILGSSNSVSNKDIMSKISTNGDKII